MSIARNFWLGQEPTYEVGPFRFLDKKMMASESMQALADVGIHIRDPEETVGTMSGGERQSIAIGRAVYFRQEAAHPGRADISAVRRRNAEST